jgi:hypothetical protein
MGLLKLMDLIQEISFPLILKLTIKEVLNNAPSVHKPEAEDVLQTWKAWNSRTRAKRNLGNIVTIVIGNKVTCISIHQNNVISSHLCHKVKKPSFRNLMSKNISRAKSELLRRILWEPQYKCQCSNRFVAKTSQVQEFQDHLKLLTKLDCWSQFTNKMIRIWLDSKQISSQLTPKRSQLLLVLAQQFPQEKTLDRSHNSFTKTVPNNQLRKTCKRS